MSMRYPGGLIATSPVNARYPSGVWTQAQAAPYQAQNVWTRDQFWPNTTLLLQGDGATNGAQNNTFLDSSSNNFTITRNGNTTQGAFTPYEPSGYWSNVGVPNGSNAITTTYPGLSGTGDYTVSFWIYLNSWTGGDNNGSDGGFVYIYGQGASHPTYPFAVRITKAGKVVVVDSVNFGPTWESTFDYAGSYNTANSIGLNRWNYIHIVRSSGTLSIYANGGLQLSVSQASAMAAPYTNGTINDGNGFDGYVSNFRIATTAVTNATPPTGPSSASNAVLLTCASNRFQDLTGTYTVTPSGSASVQSFQPFPGATTWSASVLGGSGYFDGSGDYLTVASATALNLGSGDFTIEVFWYPTAFSTDDALVMMGTSAGSFCFALYNNSTGGGVIALAGTGGGSWDILSGLTVGTAVLNQWNHVVLTRSGTTFSTYMNGVRGGTQTSSSALGSANLGIAANSTGGSGLSAGYLSDLRILKGTSLYSGATITVPTAPLTAITNTSLLCSFTNAGIYDNSMMNNLETVGNAQVSTSVVKYGTGSMAFDGSGDYLDMPSNIGFTFGTGDFTIEFWLNTSLTGFNIMNPATATGTGYWGLLVQTSNLRWNSAYNVTNLWLVDATPILNGQWNHVAICRSAGVTRAFFNGVAVATNADTTNYSGVGAWRIGSGNVAGLNGYIDDFRITKSARYITNFTPPPARLPAQ